MAAAWRKEILERGTDASFNTHDALPVSSRDLPLRRQCFNPKEERTQHGVKALDGGDADAADAVELRALQVLGDLLPRLSFGFLHEARKIAEIWLCEERKKRSAQKKKT
jgi:hypothetical protein